MLGANVNETVIFIVILAVIFGGVAGTFFLIGRSKSSHGYNNKKSEW